MIASGWFVLVDFLRQLGRAYPKRTLIRVFKWGYGLDDLEAA